MWAVSHIDWFNHELTTEFYFATSWQSALAQHPKWQELGVEMPATLEEAKQLCFDIDMMMHVAKVPSHA